MRFLRLSILTLAMSCSLVGAASAYVPDADSTHQVPEPGTMALLATGLGIGAAAYFRKRK